MNKKKLVEFLEKRNETYLPVITYINRALYSFNEITGDAKEIVNILYPCENEEMIYHWDRMMESTNSLFEAFKGLVESIYNEDTLLLEYLKENESEIS